MSYTVFGLPDCASFIEEHRMIVIPYTCKKYVETYEDYEIAITGSLVSGQSATMNFEIRFRNETYVDEWV